jgi:hypothetical protein
METMVDDTVILDGHSHGLGMGFLSTFGTYGTPYAGGLCLGT